MAERSAVLGFALGNMDYPAVQLERAWKRTISHQFHDDLPGTSIQKAYLRSWNDYVVSLNQFENEFNHSVSAVASSMDTSWVKGTAVIVNNSIEQKRCDIATVKLCVSENKSVTVCDFDGNVLPSEIIKRENGLSTIVFLAEMPPLGYKVFDVLECDNITEKSDEVYATADLLENQKYIVKINENGEISSIYDKQLKKELLKSPVRHQMINYSGSPMWPAWELTYKSIYSDKIKYPALVSKKVLYSGKAAAAVEIISRFGGSTIKSVVSLSYGGKYVKVENEVDWWAQKTLYKDSFNLNVSNNTATYDLGLGAIKRTNNTEKLFEVPAQKWADITENNFGISIFSDCKYGWDKPTDNCLRMTVLHTPGCNFLRESMQSLMDIGLNRYSFAVFSHNSGLAETQKYSREFNQPLTAVISDKHNGTLGSSYSFGAVSSENVILRALKKAEDSDEIIVRFNEGTETVAKDVRFSLGCGIESAKEVFASEEYISDAEVKNGELVFDLPPYGIKSFALKLKPFDFAPKEFQQSVIYPQYNYVAFTENDRNVDPVINYSSQFTLPKELNPRTICYKGLKFVLDCDKAVKCCGQKILLGKKYEKLFLLAFSLKDDIEAEFKADSTVVKRIIHSTSDRVGRWDMVGLSETAKIKECNIAYEFTHAHNEKRADIIARQSFVFCYEFNVENSECFVLPQNENIVVLAFTAANNYPQTDLTIPLYDRVEERNCVNKFGSKEKRTQLLGRLPHNARPPAYKVRRDDGKKIK